MATKSHLEMTLLEQSQAQKEITINEALARIDAVMNTGARPTATWLPRREARPRVTYISWRRARPARGAVKPGKSLITTRSGVSFRRARTCCCG